MPKAKTTTKSSASKPNPGQIKFNRLQVLLIVLALAIIGVVVVYKSHASSLTNWESLLKLGSCPYNASGTPATLQTGIGSTCVAFLQLMLERGGANKSVYTRQYDAKTKLYVQEFQQQNGLTANGIVGPTTWFMLDSCVIADANRDGKVNVLDLYWPYGISPTGWNCRKL